MRPLQILDARVMGDGEASGHGDRWAVFSDDPAAFIGAHLPQAVSEGRVATTRALDAAAMDDLLRAGEPKSALLLHCLPYQRGGFMNVVEMDAGNPPSNELVSFYPYLGHGVQLHGQVARIHLYPNRLEAVLELAIDGWPAIPAFDPLFANTRGHYRVGSSHSFNVAALAYLLEPAARARHAFLPQGPHTAEAEIRGEVVAVTPRAALLPGMNFWQVDVAVARNGAGEGLVLPVYVADRTWKTRWRPKAGDWVEGVAWVQGHAN